MGAILIIDEMQDFYSGWGKEEEKLNRIDFLLELKTIGESNKDKFYIALCGNSIDAPYLIDLRGVSIERIANMYPFVQHSISLNNDNFKTYALRTVMLESDYKLVFFTLRLSEEYMMFLYYYSVGPNFRASHKYAN